MHIRTTLIASSLIAASLISGAAHATLMGRDLNGSADSFEAYYDTDLNITWLANAHDGPMIWADAMAWAADLSYTDGVNTYDNWRLPTTLQPDSSCGIQEGGVSYGYNCTGSEMGHLFYSELGGTAGQSIVTSADPDLAKFTIFPAGPYYWSATKYAPSRDGAWLFDFDSGLQYARNNIVGYYALAVSPGDVAAANNNPVPEPQTLALLGLGLLGLAVARRRG